MSPAGDGIDDAFEELFQHGMALSAQVGREVSRVWEGQLRNKTQLSEREASRLQMAFDTEKRTALSVLKPTAHKGWWDQAKPSEVAEAYRVASAWSAHEPAAAAAEKMILEQAATRFGLDAEALAQLAPERAPLAAAAGVITKGQGASATVGAVAAEAKAIRGQAHGLEEAAAAEFADGRQERIEAGKALDAGPSPAEEEWYRDTFLGESPEIDQAYENYDVARSSARSDDQAGTRLLGQAESAHLAADKQEALAERMRAAGAPERGVAALQFAQSQQKYPIAHAAAGKGKTVNKVRTNTPVKAAAQGKTISR